MEEHVLVISGKTVRTIYKDAIDLRALGHVKITRAGNVEWNEERQGFEVSFPDGTFICGIMMITGSRCPINQSDRITAAAFEHSRYCTPYVFDTYEAAVAAEEIEVKQRLTMR